MRITFIVHRIYEYDMILSSDVRIGVCRYQSLILLHCMNNIDICKQLMYKTMIIDKDNTQYVKVCIKAAYSLC